MFITYRVGDRLLSINDEPLKSLVETEQILKRLPKGPVKIVAMPPPPTDEKDDDWSQYILSPSADTASDKGIITVEVSYILVYYLHTIPYIM